MARKMTEWPSKRRPLTKIRPSDGCKRRCRSLGGGPVVRFPRIWMSSGECRFNTVQAFLVPGVLPEEALKALQVELDARGFELSDNYRLEYGGDADARSSTLNNLLASLGIIVTLSIATIVLTFNSFRLSLITFIVAGLSAGLSLLSLAVFQYPLGIVALIGVIGSIGVSINAAIIILTGLQKSDEARLGNRAAMTDVVMGQSRHIISTTVTTFGGFLPLLLAGRRVLAAFCDVYRGRCTAFHRRFVLLHAADVRAAVPDTIGRKWRTSRHSGCESSAPIAGCGLNRRRSRTRSLLPTTGSDTPSCRRVTGGRCPLIRAVMAS